ncbi:MAG TPA: prevent-host-death protein [Cytophagales bacterium]|nr:prevent-host-death protein [Cytophagales bacterium]
MKNPILLLVFITLSTISNLWSQSVMGTLRGKVIDQNSEIPIPMAHMSLRGNKGEQIITTDLDGNFAVKQLAVGRYSVEISYVGYETVVLTDVLVSSTSTPFLTIKLKESVSVLDDVVVRVRQEKEAPLNPMASVSAKQLNMEEANRFAGGFDDPARLVSSFAGVASGVGENLLVVRGNSPKGILWQIEGIPVPNPNHFAEINGFGGGGITALSSRTIGNSDFFTGAFPAEYGNALASVFDLSIRNGDYTDFHHSAQVGTLGLDVASEGPINRASNSSYLFNYRYSTLGLLGLGVDYQDLSFKFNLPTENLGTFSIWGLGLIDASESTPDTDTLESDFKWQYVEDLSSEYAQLSTGVGGITHKYFVGKGGYIQTTATVAANEISATNSRLDDDYVNTHILDSIEYQSVDYRLSSTLNYKFSPTHSNRTGVLYTHLNYDFTLQNAPQLGSPLQTIAEDDGQSHLIQAFTQSSIALPKLQINPGLHVLHFTLNGNTSVEPRLGVTYFAGEKAKLSLGYGLHSQIEKLSFYLADVPVGTSTQQLNRDLGFTKAHHVVLAYDRMLGEHTHLRIEPYYQYLYDVPVVDSSHFSMINLTDDFFINSELVNEGTGTNMGVDVTLEQFLHKGFYYLTTLSVFDSKYTDGNGQEWDTRFNRNVIANVVAGKEWTIKENNLLGANIKYTYMGGSRMHPLDNVASLDAETAIDDLTQPYGERTPDSHIASFTLTYRINKPRYSSHFSLQVLNTLAADEYLGYQYNFRNHTMDFITDAIVLPNLTYKIEF